MSKRAREDRVVCLSFGGEDAEEREKCVCFSVNIPSSRMCVVSQRMVVFKLYIIIYISSFSSFKFDNCNSSLHRTFPRRISSNARCFDASRLIELRLPFGAVHASQLHVSNPLPHVSSIASHSLYYIISSLHSLSRSLFISKALIPSNEQLHVRSSQSSCQFSTRIS